MSGDVLNLTTENFDELAVRSDLPVLIAFGAR